MTQYYPPVGFHFKVEVIGLKANDHDVHFTDVGGLNIEMSTEEIAEGGQNRFLQKYPQRVKHPELTLKRGLLLNSEIVKWVRDCIENFIITPKNIDITLLNEERNPLLTWHVVNAYPTKWSCSDLSATNNAIVVESLQFFYQYFSTDSEG
ncbi:phage tail protein [Gynuella sp.]|uniref:phage tail protein n=1 Tax=Gynuella sp. TaxID=2969146 RepID=UPI003D0AE2CF